MTWHDAIVNLPVEANPDALWVLIIEDDDDQAHLVAEAMAGIGLVHHDQARTVAEAIPKMVDRRYDLVVLDLGLPDADGLELIGRQRQGLPMLVVTGDPDAERRVRALDLGADDLVVKPFDLLELGVRARRALRLHDGMAAVEMVTRTLASEITQMSDLAALHDAAVIEGFREALAIRNPTLAARAARLASMVEQLATAVDLDEIAELLGKASACYQLGALVLDDATMLGVLADERGAREQCARTTIEFLGVRHPLGAAAAAFALADTHFDRHVDRLSASMTAVCHAADVAVHTRSLDPAGTAAVLRADTTLDPALVEVVLEHCLPPADTIGG